MKKILLIFVMIIIMVVSLCSCASVSGDMENSRNNTKFQMWLNVGSCFVYSFRDEETGVWYVSTDEGVTPRLNADGSLYVD